MNMNEDLKRIQILCTEWKLMKDQNNILFIMLLLLILDQEFVMIYLLRCTYLTHHGNTGCEMGKHPSWGASLLQYTKHTRSLTY